MTDTTDSTRPESSERRTTTVTIPANLAGTLKAGAEFLRGGGTNGGTGGVEPAFDPSWDKHADVLADDSLERSVWAELPGAIFARSWLAVSLASSDDEKKSAYFRAMNIEVFAEGVRLTATNGVWSAQAWVPTVEFAGDVSQTEPGDDVKPVGMFTVFDADWRVRAMMKFLAKLAKDPGEDVGPPVRLAVRPAPSTSDSTPVLGEVFEARELHVDIPDLERVTVKVLEQQSWWDWRKAMVATPAELRDEIRLTSLSDSVLSAFGKLPKIALGIGITVDWDGSDKGFWTVTGSTLDFPPHGIVSTL